MVQRGVPFKAVADVLGHTRLQTTAVYAKLDLATLAWPSTPAVGLRGHRELVVENVALRQQLTAMKGRPGAPTCSDRLFWIALLD